MRLLGSRPGTTSPVVLVGEFDGMHVGHGRLVEAAAELAGRRRAAVVAVVLDRGRADALRDLADRVTALRTGGAADVRVVQVASPDPAEVVTVVCTLVDPAAVVLACGTAANPDAPGQLARAEPLIEAHLLDFDGDLYDRTITVELHDFLRPETRFDGIDALRLQLARDVAAVRAGEVVA